MTCKDCLLRPMCFAVREIGEKDICAEHCPKFKNKADFVEVVRCKDCKYCTVHNSPTLYAYCEKTHFRFEPFETDTRTHFCSYGERK